MFLLVTCWEVFSVHLRRNLALHPKEHKNMSTSVRKQIYLEYTFKCPIQRHCLPVKVARHYTVHTHKHTPGTGTQWKATHGLVTRWRAGGEAPQVLYGVPLGVGVQSELEVLKGLPKGRDWGGGEAFGRGGEGKERRVMYEIFRG